MILLINYLVLFIENDVRLNGRQQNEKTQRVVIFSTLRRFVVNMHHKRTRLVPPYLIAINTIIHYLPTVVLSIYY